MLRLLQQQGICKALMYDSKNFLDLPDIIDPTTLVYKKIFPYKFVPDVQTMANTYITMQFRNYRPIKTHFKSGLIRINVLVHHNLHETDHGFLRSDYLISEIDKIMNQEHGIGIGKLEFHHMDEIPVNDKYHCYFVEYKPVEFN